MKNKLVAALACRNQRTELYGKPIQNLDVKGITILDNIISCLKSISCIDEIVLGISEGSENQIFKIAYDNKLKYIIGDEEDVLSRLIKCGQHLQLTFLGSLVNPFLF